MGNWNPGSAAALGASQYTDRNPLWSGSLNLTPGAVIEYKFLAVGGSGSVAWETYL